MKRAIQFLCIVTCFCGSARVATADWLQFRGPGGRGIAPDKGLPVTWSDDANIAWKVEMPGSGASCPIIVGDRVIITCYSGYGVDRNNAGDQKDLKRHLLCLDRKSGKKLWSRDFPAPVPEATYSGFQLYHGYASSTPISDGKNVWVFFGKDGVYCFDLEGKQQWHTSVGTKTNGWGSGTSPILHADLLIVNAAVESGSLVALDKNSGKVRWTTKGLAQSWNTPTLVKTAGAATELVLAANKQMRGFDPATGKELWNANVYDWYVCPSIVAHDGVLYGLQHSICVAVKAGGKGDVTDTHVLWKKKFGHVVSSPLYHDGNVYFNSAGTAHCVKASDGSNVYKERLKGGGETYASPLLADGKIYYVSRSSGTHVIEAGPKFNLLAHNTLDKTIFNANPAVSQSQLFLRSERFLYCIGKEK